MKRFYKYLTTMTVAVALLFTANCKKDERPGDGETGVILAGLIKDMASGNCAISVNLDGLYYGAIVQRAVTLGSGLITATDNLFDYTDYKEATGKDFGTDSATVLYKWSTLPYNERYDAFFTDGGTWNVEKRNAALKMAKGVLDALSAVGAGVSACKVLPPGSEPNIATVVATAKGYLTGDDLTNANIGAALLWQSYMAGVLKGVGDSLGMDDNPNSTLGSPASLFVTGGALATTTGITALAHTDVNTDPTKVSTLIGNIFAAPTAAGGCGGSIATAGLGVPTLTGGLIPCVALEGLLKFAAEAGKGSYTLNHWIDAPPSIANYATLTTDAEKGLAAVEAVGGFTGLGGSSATAYTCGSVTAGTPTIISSIASGGSTEKGSAAATGLYNVSLAVGARTAVGSGVLACARIPKTSCSFGAVTTPNKDADIASKKASYALITSGISPEKPSNCAQPDAEFSKGLAYSLIRGLKEGETVQMGPYTLSNPVNNGATSGFASNQILADKAYPKFGTLVDLGFDALMPMKDGTAAYSTDTSSTSANAFVGGGNLSVSLVPSCESLGLTTGYYPNATTRKELASVQENIYTFSANGAAASAYASAKLYAAGASVSGTLLNSSSNSYLVEMTLDVTCDGSGTKYATFSMGGTTAYVPYTMPAVCSTTASATLTGPTTAMTPSGYPTTPVRSYYQYTTRDGGYPSFSVTAAGTYKAWLLFSSTGGMGQSFVNPDGKLFATSNTFQQIACNNYLRRNTSIPSVVGGKLEEVDAASGDGGKTSTLSLCIYGNDSAKTAAKGILNTGLYATTVNSVVPTELSVQECSTDAKGAAAQFNGMTTK